MTVCVEGERTSQPYVELTVALMARFGIQVERPDDRTYVVPKQAYVSPEVQGGEEIERGDKKERRGR